MHWCTLLCVEADCVSWEPIDLSLLDTQASNNAVSFVHSRIIRMDGTLLYVCMFIL